MRHPRDPSDTHAAGPGGGAAASHAYVPALDGVRGLAILLVLAAHSVANLAPTGAWAAPVALARFGWTGVDLFFVLSGWLITGLLLDAVGVPGARRAFYVRRALRIWPLYVLLLAVLTTVALAFPAYEPTERAEFLHATPWYWTHAYNWYLVVVASPDAGAYGTGVLWSLAIEEQFYLVWPFVVAWLDARRLVRLCVGLALGSALLRAVLLAADVPYGTLTVLPFTRLEGLAIGAGLAGAARVPAWWAVVAARTRALAARPLWAAIGALAVHAAIVAAMHVAGRPAQEAVGVPLATAWFGVVLAAAVAHGPATPLARALAVRPLRAAGRISYGLYVWHLPAQVFVGRAVQRAWPAGGDVAAYAASTVAAVAVAVLSWVAWERPWLRLRPSTVAFRRPADGTSRRPAWRRWRLPAVTTPRRAAVGLFLGACAFSLAANVVLWRRVRRLERADAVHKLDPIGLWPHAAERAARHAVDRSAPLVMLYGDSRAAWWPALPIEGAVVVNRGVAAQATEQLVARYAVDVAPLRPTVVVIQAGVNDLATLPLLPAQRTAIVQRCRANLAQLVARARGDGAAVVLTTIFPLARARWRAHDPAIDAAVVEVNAFIRSLHGEGVQVVDAARLLADASGGVRPAFAADALHLSDAGYAAITPAVTAAVRRGLRAATR